MPSNEQLMLGDEQYGGNEGFDGVMHGPDGSVIIASYAKGKDISEGFWLTHTNMGLEMSSFWIDKVLANLDPASQAAILVKQARANGSLKTVVYSVDRKSGTLISLPISVP